MSQYRDPASVHNERLEALSSAFAARSRAAKRRSAFYALLGAILVVAFGAWSFAVETNTRNMPLLPPVPTGGTGPIMVVIAPSR